MRNFTLFILAIFLGVAVLSAQTPQSFRYQAVARDNSGNVLANQAVSFRISILSGSVSGTEAYSETHSGITTNAFGLVELEIGKGTPVTGTFSAIDWGSNSYFVKIEMDPEGGIACQTLSTSQLLSVPYALHSKTVETGDNWGTQNVVTDATLTGNGTTSSNLKLAQQSATSGQVLKWNGTTWSPSEDVNSGLTIPYIGFTDAKNAFNVISSSIVENSTVIGGSSTSSSNMVTGVAGTSSSTSGRGVTGTVSSITGETYGVFGLSKSSSGRGVYGFADAQSGTTHGVFGQSYSPTGYGVYGIAPNYGVYGRATNDTDNSTGVYGISNSSVGRGVTGYAESTTGNSCGIYGVSMSAIGAGVVGRANATTGKNSGIIGFSSSNQGIGAGGTAMSETGTTYGVYGLANSPDGYGVYGQAQKYGVFGNTNATTGETFGVYGSSASTSGVGVYGKAEALTGSNYGVTGRSDSPSGTGVYGISGAATGAGSGIFGISISTQGSYGVKGISYATTGTNTGVYGASFATNGFGVYGYASSSSGKTYGIYGYSKSSEGFGVYGLSDSNTGKTYGVYGQTTSDQGYGVYGFASSLSGINCGIYGNSVSGTGYGVLGAGWTGVRGQTSSSSGYGLEGVSSSSTGGTMAVRGIVTSPDGYSGYFSGGKFYINGNTGIGIENPGAKLDVNGQVKITGGSPGAGKVLTSDASGLASWQTPSPVIGPGGSDGSIQYNSSGRFAGEDKLYWSGQRLGIGTNSPARPLTVSGGSSSGSSAGFVNDETGYGWFDGLTIGIGHTNEGMTTQLWNSENCKLVFATNNSWKMEILPNGNVGIGKYNPPYKLDVVGNRIRLNNADETAWIAMRTDGSAGILDLSYSGGKLAIGGSNTGENILLNPGTNAWVGVRTWNPQYELDVTGNIRATGSVYYGGTAGSANGTAYNKPDFVFNQEYEIMNTEQVEDFLNKENHLPWVTSAKKEKEENGDVTDMTRMAFETLEAVENIQLQLIEQKNLVKELKIENERLKADNEKISSENAALSGRLEKIEVLMGINTSKKSGNPVDTPNNLGMNQNDIP